MTARTIISLRPALRGFSPNQLVEVAPSAGRQFVLHQQGKIALVEFIEPLIPVDMFQ